MNIYAIEYREKKYANRHLRPFTMFIVAESKPDAEQRATGMLARYPKYEFVAAYYRESVGNLRVGTVLSVNFEFLT